MHKKHVLMRLKLLVAITLINIILSACTSSSDNYREPGIQETVSAQNTRIAQLSTQVAHLELTAPIPPGITLTPTPYSPSDRGKKPTFTPTPSAPIDIEYPPDTRTGLEEIDHVIDVIMQADIQGRLDLVRFTTTACTTLNGLGGPPSCEPGEADGTLVESFPVSNGEGHFARPDKIQEVFDFTAQGLFAVYVVPEDAYQKDYWPAGEYGIIFTSQDGGYPHVINVLVEDAFIVRLDFIPGWPPFDMVLGKSDEFILPPIR